MKHAAKTKKNKTLKTIIEWVICIVTAVVLSTLVNKYLILKVNIPSESMVPTLNVSDQLLALKVYNSEKLDRGDIVIFYSRENKDTFIKRLIGLPGDKIVIDNGNVYINGKEIKQDYVKNKDDFYGTYEVPDGKYFFLGDNRPVSNDSRKWKNHFVDGKDIKGKAIFRLAPKKKIGFLD